MSTMQRVLTIEFTILGKSLHTIHRMGLISLIIILCSTAICACAPLTLKCPDISHRSSCRTFAHTSSNISWTYVCVCAWLFCQNLYGNRKTFEFHCDFHRECSFRLCSHFPRCPIPLVAHSSASHTNHNNNTEGVRMK